MKKLLIFSLFLSFSILVFAQDATTFILVRHSEKAQDGTKNPPLNETGKVRANELAEMLSNQSIDALYSTDFKRTKETLKPIAGQQNLEIMTYDPFAKAEWLSSLIEKHENETIVISGHSNTIPGLANALLGASKFEQFDDSDYSNLIIIVASKAGEGTLIRLKF